MSSREFNTFSIEHRNLLLKVVEVKQEVRRGQEQSLVSGAPAERGSDRVARDVVRLQHQAEIYQQDVLASTDLRRRDLHEATPGRRFTDNGVIWPTDYVVFRHNTEAFNRCVCNESNPVFITKDNINMLAVDRQPYMAVAHIRPESPEAGDSDEPTDESYRQILILESKDKTVIMINPNRCYVNDDENTLNEDSLLEMSRAGEALLQATDPNK
ncbi:hypothetical protein BN14_08630 [Rhizoctonia solani AG-1 IB]|uniref:Uncharacterized protein n=1 Tax=Thanatephorus cucumeris (strain AG1-IB / isolate 7/3/14) TaxID=1108050 RepID=M5C3J7_THACB|nr:hypothetical protein BN14_08630 [Rhizoctonia solani AG-1 IB]